jgi:NADPH:quinone reductase-like Zn-dependent oxidoreductase
MKAIAHARYGPPDVVLEQRDVPEPTAADGAVVVRVRATSINAADWHMVRGDPYIARVQMGLREPKATIPGCDVAGEVEAVGAGVTSVRPGDEVFGSVYASGYGAFAERVRVPQEVLVAKPASLSFAQAAAVPLAGSTALQSVRDHGRVEGGQKVLIIGASGGVGTFAVQIAKALGAEVTGVCSTAKADLVRSIGADHVLDYTRDDVAGRGERYDLIVQVGGTASPGALRRALAPKGTLVSISGDSEGHWIGPLGRMARVQLLAPFVGQRLVVFTVKPDGDGLRTLKDLIDDGKITPVIDREYALSEVPEAIRYLESGQVRGKLVVTV